METFNTQILIIGFSKTDYKYFIIFMCLVKSFSLSDEKLIMILFSVVLTPIFCYNIRKHCIDMEVFYELHTEFRFFP